MCRGEAGIYWISFIVWSPASLEHSLVGSLAVLGGVAGDGRSASAMLLTPNEGRVFLGSSEKPSADLANLR